MSPTVTNLQQPSCDDLLLYGYNTSLSPQLPPIYYQLQDQVGDHSCGTLRSPLRSGTCGESDLLSLRVNVRVNHDCGAGVR